MPLEAPVITAAFSAMVTISLSDSGLARLAHLRFCRDGGSHRDHGGGPDGSPDPDGPADHARHARHGRPGSRSGARHPDPFRKRTVFRALLRLRLCAHGAIRMAAWRNFRIGTRAAGADPDHSCPALFPSADGIRADRAGARPARAPSTLR